MTTATQISSAGNRREPTCEISGGSRFSSSLRNSVVLVWSRGETGMTKAVGYIRVSTQGKVRDGYSLAYQRDESIRHCDEVKFMR